MHLVILQQTCIYCKHAFLLLFWMLFLVLIAFDFLLYDLYVWLASSAALRRMPSHTVLHTACHLQWRTSCLLSLTALTLCPSAFPLTAYCVESPRDVSLSLYLTRIHFIWLRSFFIIMKPIHTFLCHTENWAVDIVGGYCMATENLDGSAPSLNKWDSFRWL